MQRVSVDSSNVESVGHDSSSNILEVMFRNGRLYHYYGVLRRVYEELLAAESHGKYLNAHIKGVYRYKQIN